MLQHGGAPAADAAASAAGAQAAGTPQAADARVRLSVRLEQMGLTDQEVAMFAAWSSQEASRAALRKLWFFSNQISDEGAAEIAKLVHSGMAELHLR